MSICLQSVSYLENLSLPLASHKAYIDHIGPHHDLKLHVTPSHFTQSPCLPRVNHKCPLSINSITLIQHFQDHICSQILKTVLIAQGQLPSGHKAFETEVKKLIIRHSQSFHLLSSMIELGFMVSSES